MQPEISDKVFYSFLSGGFCASSTTTTTTTTTTTSAVYPFGIEEMISRDRTLASLRNHKEAERRRRERINSNLNNLRNLLSCNSKINKATLLTKVVERVKELKQQTLEFSNETLPSETDEISVLNYEDYCSKDDGRTMFKVLLSCEERQDLLQDLVESLKSLQMKTVYADMTTIGGRTRHVLLVVADKEKQDGVVSVRFLQNALESLLQGSSKLVMMGRGGGKCARSHHNGVILM